LIKIYLIKKQICVWNNTWTRGWKKKRNLLYHYYTMGVTSWAGTPYPSGALDY